jgi:hypothetical protein
MRGLLWAARSAEREAARRATLLLEALVALPGLASARASSTTEALEGGTFDLSEDSRASALDAISAAPMALPSLLP